MRRSITLYPYDPQLRPGTLGADFESDNPNEEFTMHFEPDEAERLMHWARVYLKLDRESR